MTAWKSRALTGRITVYERLSDGFVVPNDPTNSDYALLPRRPNGTIDALDPEPDPVPDIPAASILRLLLADVSDVDETKPILDAMLILLGG